MRLLSANEALSTKDRATFRVHHRTQFLKARSWQQRLISAISVYAEATASAATLLPGAHGLTMSNNVFVRMCFCRNAGVVNTANLSVGRWKRSSCRPCPWLDHYIGQHGLATSSYVEASLTRLRCSGFASKVLKYTAATSMFH